AVAADTALNLSDAAGAPLVLTQAGGALTAGGGLVQHGGRFDFAGGRLSGAFTLFDARIDVAAGVTEPATLQVVGMGDVLLGNASPAVTVWVEGGVANQTVLTV